MPKISSRQGKDEIVIDQEKGHREKGQNFSIFNNINYMQNSEFELLCHFYLFLQTR